MVYLWDYDEKELEKTEKGRILILERLINYGPSKKGEKIKIVGKSTVEEFFQELIL